MATEYDDFYGRKNSESDESEFLRNLEPGCEVIIHRHTVRTYNRFGRPIDRVVKNVKGEKLHNGTTKSAMWVRIKKQEVLYHHSNITCPAYKTYRTLIGDETTLNIIHFENAVTDIKYSNYNHFIGNTMDAIAKAFGVPKELLTKDP